MNNIEQEALAATMTKLRAKLQLEMPNNPAASGWAAFSQCDEDGIIRACLTAISQTIELSRTFVEVGCANGLENNTHQLLLDGYSGFWVDSDREKIRFIQNQLGGLHFDRLRIQESLITPDNIGSLVEQALLFLNTSDLDFFSLDIDGFDIHVLPPVLQRVAPKLICVEYNAKFVPPTRIAVAYNPQHVWAGDDYFGASLQSWVDSLTNYALVCCNFSGANAFFVRRDLLNNFTLTPVERLYQPPPVLAFRSFERPRCQP